MHRKPIVLDKTGFPMVFISEMDMYVQWFPITKIQFERLLPQLPKRDFSFEIYQSLLTLNPRISPQHLTIDNYWMVFLTGILPREATLIQDAFGDRYFIPDKDQWQNLYNILKSKNEFPLLSGDLPLRDRDRSIVTALAHETTRLKKEDRTSAEQLLLVNGVMEWIRCYDGKSAWAGMGKPLNKFYPVGIKRADRLDPVSNAETERRYYYGLRLFCRP